MAVFKLRIKMSRKKKAKSTKTGKKSVWSDEKVDELIGEYEANEILYNKKCSGYANRDLREMTYAEIGKKFKVSGEEIEDSLATLRTRLGQIRREELKAKMKSGSAPVELTDEAKEFKRKMSFLYDHIKTRISVDSLGRQNEQPEPQDGQSDMDAQDAQDEIGSQHEGADGGVMMDAQEEELETDNTLQANGVLTDGADALEAVVMGGHGLENEDGSEIKIVQSDIEQIDDPIGILDEGVNTFIDPAVQLAPAGTSETNTQ